MAYRYGLHHDGLAKYVSNISMLGEELIGGNLGERLPESNWSWQLSNSKATKY